MTLTETKLRKLQESMRFSKMNSNQASAILERFSVEPDPYEWSEQDIVTQILTFLEWGTWEKPSVSFATNENLAFPESF